MEPINKYSRTITQDQTQPAAQAMLRQIRGAKLFDGVRGQPARDVDALANLLAAVSEMAWLLRDRVAEMDINPVLVRPAGKGVVAADALIILK